MNKQAGISLIEIMVTLFIASLLLAYGIPNFKDFLLRQSVTTKANDMLVDFVFARSEAINRGIPVSISANPTWDQGWQVATDFNGNGTFDGNDEIIRIANKIEAKINLVDALGDGIPIIFGVTGDLMSAASRQITIKHTDISQQKVLTIALSGSISAR
ncbi:MAG: GspH/FimT family pseudopilin [Alcanivoracaceae bacterium]|nr:GspH/FimT family pseudopilin [Alcanivoracaceae bacterium]